MNTIEFQIPSTDLQLSSQVFEHLTNHEDEVDMREFLTGISKKYRFAGYIGSLDFLFGEIAILKDKLEKTCDELEKIKKHKRFWLF